MALHKKSIIGLAAAFVAPLLMSGGAQAANWFKLRGTEPGGTAHTLQVWGFLQPQYVRDNSDDISGAVKALAPANGTKPVPGTIPPDRTTNQSFYMRRARIGIRGTMIPISNDIDYFILTEWGQNGVTRSGGAAHLLDASMTFNQLSRGFDDDGNANIGLRIRVGQFLFSQTSEALSHSTPGRRVHIFMPEGTFQTALYRQASDNGRHNWPEDEVAVNGGRDVGIELFDFPQFKDPIFGGGPLEFTYSYAIGNGNTIGEQDRDGNFRHYGWLSLAKLFDDTRGPRRHDMQVYGWYQRGDIGFNTDIDNNGVPDNQPGPTGDLNPGNLAIGPVSAGNRLVKNGNQHDYKQEFWGYGFEYFDKPFNALGQIRFNAEYLTQRGIIFDGPQSPSAGVNDNVGGFDSILYDVHGKSTGWYVDLGYDIQQHLRAIGIPAKRTTLNVRYDEFARNNGDPGREADFKTWTVSAEYFFHKKARVTATYQFRDYDANKRTGVAKTNGNAVLENVGDRLGLQVTFVYKNVLLH